MLERRMIWADWFLVGALVISILIGAWRGFTREVLGLLSWILAVIAALYLAPAAERELVDLVATPSIRIAAAYAIVFFAALLVGAIVTSLVALLVRQSPLSSADRVIGGGFGLVRGVLIAVLLVWVVGLTPARQDAWWGQSTLIPPLDRIAGDFRRWLPEQWQKELQPLAGSVVKEGV